MSYGIELLNSIRPNSSAEYVSRVPVATRDTLATIGRVLDTYNVVYNEFIDSLMHRIGFTIVQTALFTNKLAKFKSGRILTGQDVEDIFVNAFRAAEGAYDKEGGVGENGVHPFKRRDYNDAQTKFYRMNRRDKYTITIYKDDVIRAFNSETALEQFITAQFNSLYTSAEYDEWEHMKQMLHEAIAAGDFKTYLVPTIGGASATDSQNQSACKSFVRSVKKAIADVSYPSTLYNPAGVKTKSDKSSLVLFINKDIPAHLEVDLYAQIFGPSYTQLGIEIVEVDNFGADATGTYALLVDKSWFKVFDVKNEMTQLFNPDGLYTNFWLHIWQILAYSKFATAVRFGTSDVTGA